MPTLVVETGAGTDPNANSYCTQVAAEAYMDARLYATEWNDKDSADKVRALIHATRCIDANCRFRGYRKLGESQPLSWPRVRARNDDVYTVTLYPTTIFPGAYYDENSIPAILRDGTALQALELLRVDRTADSDTKGISSFSLPGPLSFSFEPTGKPTPLSDEVKRMLGRLVITFRTDGGNKKVVRRI